MPMCPNPFPSGMKMAPEVAPLGPFPLVALGRFSPNTLLTGVQDDVSEVERPTSYVSPPRHRRRITSRLRTEVVEAYDVGQTSRQVAERFGLGRPTVLGILKTAGVTVRPQGRR
jgi:hypothetical protein